MHASGASGCIPRACPNEIPKERFCDRKADDALHANHHVLRPDAVLNKTRLKLENRTRCDVRLLSDFNRPPETRLKLEAKAAGNEAPAAKRAHQPLNC